MQPSVQRGGHQIPDLAIVLAGVRLDNSGFQIKVREPLERESALSGVLCALLQVVFNFHTLLWQQKYRRATLGALRTSDFYISLNKCIKRLG